MIQKLFCFFCLAFLLSEIDGHTYHLGKCPAIEPVADFNMNRMLGIWYVVQKTSTASTCITYNFTELAEPHHYNLEEVKQRFFLGLTPLQHEHHSSGKLFTPDPLVPGKLKVKFSSNVIGKASFTVFMTDYDNYAGIFTCQGLGVGHRQSASILSRTPTLDHVYVDKLRARLSSCNIDPIDLSIVSHADCPRNINVSEGVYINGDDETDATIEEITEYINESTNRVNTDDQPDPPIVVQEGSTESDLLQGGSTESDLLQDVSSETGEMVDFDTRSMQEEITEWLP